LPMRFAKVLWCKQKQQIQAIENRYQQIKIRTLIIDGSLKAEDRSND
jgi:hypothetical protein